MPEIKPKSRRKLNRAQISEILERNVMLYKAEATFVHYLVDLALYLLEYEYDWESAATGTLPPGASATPSTGSGTSVLPAHTATPIPSGARTTAQIGLAAPPDPAAVPHSPAVVSAAASIAPRPDPRRSGDTPRILTVAAHNTNLKPIRRLCPYCGTQVGEALVCPSCRNLTR